MRKLSTLAALCLVVPGSAQNDTSMSPDQTQRVDHVLGYAVSDASLVPPGAEPRQPGGAAAIGPDSILVASPMMGTVRARLAMKPSARWADDEILDGSEQETGGCDRVRMGLYFIGSSGNDAVMEWRYSRFDALELLKEFGVGDAVHEDRWGPEKHMELDLERTVPFTLRPNASIELECVFDPEDPGFCVV
ncbi:MAG TPA: hypothetical protein VHL57_11610, partial [Flavobacteriales bacterium]|nr:hypothetical protein [Flavobacteriales bacterium]